MKIVIAGGSGYLGQLIIDFYKYKGHQIFVLSRSVENKSTDFTEVKWDGKTLGDWTEVLERADVLINLSGKNINTKFTEENKKALLQSRIESTDILGKAIEQSFRPPKMWLNASSVAIYEESWENARDEISTELGTDFLSILSQKWEEAFYKFSNPKTKKAVFRISLILGNNVGSAYHTLEQLVKIGAGGKAGDGKQMVSWLGEKDFVRAIDFIIQNQLEGAFNFCNTNAISNQELMKQMREKHRMPFGLPAPEFFLKLGANIIGTAPDLVLRSQNVYPKRLIENGFEFHTNFIKEI